MAEGTPILRSPVPSLPAVASASLALEDLSPVRKLLVQVAGERGSDGPLDVAVGFATRGQESLVFSVSPHELFVLGAEANANADIAQDGSASSVDVTHGRALFRLTGRAAARTMEKVCALDFDDRFMPDGAAARTSVAKTITEVVRMDRDGTPSYLIACGRSFGAYLFDQLLDAAVEFGGERVEWDGRAV